MRDELFGKESPGGSLEKLTIVIANPAKRVWQCRINKAWRDIDCFPPDCDPGVAMTVFFDVAKPIRRLFGSC